MTLNEVAKNEPCVTDTGIAGSYCVAVDLQAPEAAAPSERERRGAPHRECPGLPSAGQLDIDTSLDPLGVPPRDGGGARQGIARPYRLERAHLETPNTVGA